jgi:type VI secretion system ImpH/TssG family protein
MTAAKVRAGLPVEEPVARLLARPGRFAFLAAVRLLRERGAQLRFRHDSTLAFAAAELSAVRDCSDGAGERFELVASFLGVAGSSSPAPVYLTALAAAEDEAGELRRELLDGFHHRLYELLAERLLEAEAPPRGLAAAVGVGTLAPRRLDPHALLPLAPLLVARGRSARSLTLALRHLLAVDLERHGAQLEIEEFVGDWVETGARSQFCLGDRGRSALGRSTVVGAWCRDPSSRVRVKIGRVDADAAATFSPGGAAFVRLSEALSVLVRDPLEFELELWVVGSIAPPLGALRLGVDFRVFAPKTEGRALRFPLPLPADPQRGEPFAPAPDPEGGGSPRRSSPRRSSPAAPHRDDTES